LPLINTLSERSRATKQGSSVLHLQNKQSYGIFLINTLELFDFVMKEEMSPVLP
jgi:hypothetical protein